MTLAVQAACLEELRRAGLPGQRPLARLLSMLRGAGETHLGLAAVVRMAAENGLATGPDELARQLEILAGRGLLGRLRSACGEPVFDTVTEPHSHLIYEESGQVVDLHVSAETLLAILRQALGERPDGVEILIRARGDSTGYGRSPPSRPSRGKRALAADGGTPERVAEGGAR